MRYASDSETGSQSHLTGRMAVGTGKPVPPAGPLLYQVSQTVLHSGTIKWAIRGCFSHPGKAELVLARENSLQLCSVDLEARGPVQPLHTLIQDLHLQRKYHSGGADCHHLESEPQVHLWDKDCQCQFCILAFMTN